VPEKPTEKIVTNTGRTGKTASLTSAHRSLDSIAAMDSLTTAHRTTDSLTTAHRTVVTESMSTATIQARLQHSATTVAGQASTGAGNTNNAASQPKDQK
jgi:hypothetical protein